MFENAPSAGSPSCLQTTRASRLPQPSSHTVPQPLLLQTSTRPSRFELPSTNLMSPWLHTTVEMNIFFRKRIFYVFLHLYQPGHLIPASSAWTHWFSPRGDPIGQSESLISVPLHWTWSNQIRWVPPPWPYPPPRTATAPISNKKRNTKFIKLV